MAISKSQKSGMVSSLKDNLASASFVIVVHYRGMSGRQLYDMRVNLKAKSCGMKIAKNTLTAIAIKGTEFESIASYLKGPTAILYSQDPVALSKIVTDFAKETEFLKVRVGYLDKALVQEAEISSMAKLGSLTDVRASFLGKLNAIQSNFVRVLNAPQEGLASLFAGAASKE